ncbi:MAG: hypothetical protein NZM35_01500 [Chitinophagales bacterium]|nr:hypothetical protein [Chitinophagales bacterium]MDW8418178.1 hypothetical protein [Chitinophagales bacterium]
MCGRGRFAPLAPYASLTQLRRAETAISPTSFRTLDSYPNYPKIVIRYKFLMTVIRDYLIQDVEN